MLHGGWRFAAMLFAAVALTSCDRTAEPFGEAGALANRPAKSVIRGLLEFPTPEQLEQLASLPALADMKLESGPLAQPFARWSVSDVATVAQDSEVPAPAGLELPGQTRHTREASCVAREAARLYAVGVEVPSPSLAGYLANGCGLVHLPWSRVRKVDAGDDPMVAAQSLVGEASYRGRGTPLVIGTWIGTIDGESFVAVTGAKVRLRVQPVQLVTDANYVEFAVETSGASEVAAHVTRGQDGVERCDTEVRGEHVHFNCPLDPSDAGALVEILASRRSKSLRRTVGALFVQRPGEVFRYVAPAMPSGDSKPVTPLAITAAINEVRRANHLDPVQLHQDQSRVATSLLRPFVAAERGMIDPDYLDTIALGLGAGWEVDERLASARSVKVDVPFSDPRLVVAEWLARPGIRDNLLDPRADLLSIGHIDVPDRTTGLLLSSYRLARSEPNPEIIERELFDRLDAARAREGRPPVVRARPDSEMAVQLRAGLQAVANGYDRRDAMQAAATDVSRGRALRVSAYSAVGFDPDLMPFGGLALGLPEPYVAIAVVERRPTGGRWTEYVIGLMVSERAFEGPNR